MVNGTGGCRFGLEQKWLRRKVAFFTVVCGIALAGCTSAPRHAAEDRTTVREASAHTPPEGFVLASLAAGEADELIDDDDDFDPFWDDDEFDDPAVNDPFEGLNRAFFAMNDLTYQAVLIPVSRIYGGVAPEPVQRGVRNFFNNLRYPIRVVNNLLQGKGSEAGRETQKFLLNTTVGVLGFGKPSDNHEHLRDIPREDMGQTFAAWGVGDTPYLVLPFLGPSTVRDAVGRMPDAFLYPPVYVLSADELIVTEAVDLANSSPALMREYEGMKEASVDPYAALRNAYLENRRREIAR
ncbi:MAG: VacJ family lipoprotein [Opitutales bacterium]|nr:VacJ family lipoprotein [Opitutales bacterium]